MLAHIRSLPRETFTVQSMAHKDKELPADDPIVRLTEEQIESITHAKYSELGSIEVSPDTTDEEIEKAVARIFSKEV